LVLYLPPTILISAWVKMISHWREYCSEFIGTALLLFIGIGAISLNFGSHSFIPQFIPDQSIRLLITGLMFAGGATLIIYSSLGQRSGGHINPAVTLSFWILNKIKAVDAFVYMGMQFSGAVLGTYFAALLFGEAAQSVRLGITLPGEGYTIFFVFICEVIITALLITTIFLFTSFKPLAPFTGIAAGLLVAAEVFFVAPISGTSLNPARSFGPAYVLQNFQHYWIYLFAPFLASILISVVYKQLVYKPICGKLYHTFHGGCIFNCGYGKKSH